MNIDKFKHQHTDILRGIATLRALAHAGVEANAPAIATYQRHGFAIVATDCADIGGGFVMDDYVMSRPTGPDNFLTKP